METSDSDRAIATIGVGIILGAVALVDFLRSRERATRWREYGFWLACGVLGAIFAVGNDLVTSRISEAYFALGKGLASDDPGGLAAAVVILAVRAGFAAGLAIGGALLLANNPHKDLPQLPYGALARLGLLSTLGAIVAAPLCAACTGLDVQGLAPRLGEVLSPREVDRFLLVQRIHLGLYAGALIGTVGAVARIRKERRALARDR